MVDLKSLGVNFINVLGAALAHTEAKSVKKTVKPSIFLCFWDLRAQKLYVNMLVKLTPGKWSLSPTFGKIRVVVIDIMILLHLRIIVVYYLFFNKKYR